MSRLIAVILAAIFAGILSSAPAAAADTWHRADTHNFTIYSDGKQGELEDFSHEVERLDALLRFLWGKQRVANPNKLTIYLVKDANAVDKLLGDKNTGIAGIYFPRTEGSFALANRAKSKSEFRLPGKRVLLHEYAHHFIAQNFAIPAPAWFSEGFAEYVATAEFNSKGRWSMGKAANHRVLEIVYGGPIDIRDLLGSEAHGSDRSSSFYGWSWALTHMLYTKEYGRGKVISKYLGLLNSGIEPLAAAETAFGDLDEFDLKLRDHVKRPLTYSRSPSPLAYEDRINLTELSDYDSQLVTLTLERRVGGDKVKLAASLKALTAQDGATSDAWYQLAEIEFRQAHNDEAENAFDFTAADAAVDKALALEPHHMRANVLKGLILLEPFDHGDNADETSWAKSREYFLAAKTAEPNHPLPHYALANSYVRENRSDPQASAALKDAFRLAPESAEVRYAYSLNLAEQGEFDAAIHAIRIIANDPHGNGTEARAFVEKIERMRDLSRSAPNAPDTDASSAEKGDSEADDD